VGIGKIDKCDNTGYSQGCFPTFSQATYASYV